VRKCRLLLPNLFTSVDNKNCYMINQCSYFQSTLATLFDKLSKRSPTSNTIRTLDNLNLTTASLQDTQDQQEYWQ